MLDSVLNTTDTSNSKKKGTKQKSGGGSHAEVSYAQSAGSTPQELLLDSKRNWSDDMTLQLARTWKNVQRASPNVRGAQLSEQVYMEFKSKVGSALNRSRKAVEDKMQTMKEMYRFIKAYEENRAAGEDGETKPSWFDLTKVERRQIKYCHAIVVELLVFDSWI